MGGTAAGDGNIISGNYDAGIVFWTSDAHDNVAQGNFIGTDATGTRAIGNGKQGVAFSIAGPNLVGGTSPGTGNVIAGNLDYGVGIFPGTGEIIQGNTLGKGVNGVALPNLAGNVFVSTDSTNNWITNNNGGTP